VADRRGSIKFQLVCKSGFTGRRSSETTAPAHARTSELRATGYHGRREEEGWDGGEKEREGELKKEVRYMAKVTTRLSNARDQKVKQRQQ